MPSHDSVAMVILQHYLLLIISAHTFIHTYINGFTIGEWNPKVETAVVFSTAKPHFVVVTPMFNVDSYAARNVFATIKATTGIWALDIVLDTCVDDTARAVYNMLLNYLVYHNHTASYSHMCSLLCSHRQQSRPTSVFEPSACTSASTLTRIRIITSDATLLGSF